MRDESRVALGALAGAICGAAAGYLFFTAQGRDLFGRLGPAVDEVRREFTRVEEAVEKIGELAGDGLRVIAELRAVRDPYPSSGATSH